MVKEALHERASMIYNAPHLSTSLPILLPLYKWWDIPYYWFGLKMYDLVAGSQILKSSYFVSKYTALELFPTLKGDKLTGAIVYYDGQQDDARMNLAIALSASRYGATVVNHVSVIKLLKGANKQLCGARVRDELTGDEWDVKAKAIINATGPFTDAIRRMDDQQVKDICRPSSGVHVVLPGYFCPDNIGLLNPETSDGRIIFILPWMNHTMVGTTDVACEVTANPKPTEAEISFILKEVKSYINPNIKVRRDDVLSAWSGIRPLVSDPNKPDTQSLARNHIIHVSPSKLVTIAGGKWTTYRSMAEETVDKAIKVCGLKPPKKCQTAFLCLEGAYGFTPTMYIKLIQDFGLDRELAQHLANSYGDRAFDVIKRTYSNEKTWPETSTKLHPDFPYIDAEIRYGCRDYARTAIDMIARRLRLAFLDAYAAQEALPGIVDIMAEELNWTAAEKKRQLKQAKDFLANEMGMQVVKRRPRS